MLLFVSHIVLIAENSADVSDSVRQKQQQNEKRNKQRKSKQWKDRRNKQWKDQAVRML